MVCFDLVLRLQQSYRELESFAQFGSDLDEFTASKLERGKRTVEVLKQDQNKPISFNSSVAFDSAQWFNSSSKRVISTTGISSKYPFVNELERGKRTVEVLKQDQNKPLPVEHQVLIIYALTKG
jgi:F0F1-type ATP synthase alpha subunit